MFGEVDFDPRRAHAAVGLAEQLEALGAAVAAGKVRRVGLSNETPWGLATACHLGAPRHLAVLSTWCVGDDPLFPAPRLGYCNQKTRALAKPCV